MLSRTLFSHLASCLLCDENTHQAGNLCQVCQRDVLSSPINLSFEDLVVNPHAQVSMQLAGLSELYAAFHYQWPIDQFITDYKYRSNFFVEPVLNDLLTAQLAELTIDNIDCVASVPNHNLRLLSRGFNHLAFLTKLVSEHFSLPDMSPALQRTRYSEPQAELTGKKRLRNVADIFSANADIKGLHVLLVDDVATTGATLSSLAQCLLANGASQVSALVIAWAKLT